MKIIKLTASNVKKLHAVEITPEGHVIRIGGPNGAGKSSVLDAIAYAMGGKELVPAEPIRTGEDKAEIIVNLGELIVTRKFTRDYQKCDCVVGNPPPPPAPVPTVHLPDCASKTFGETRSTLTVTTKDGAKYPSPQAIVDKFFSTLTFDPLQFARSNKKQAEETLRKLVKLDTSKFDSDRAAASSRRGAYKKQLAEKVAQNKTLSHFPEAGLVETSMTEISDEMRRAEELRVSAAEADKLVSAQVDTIHLLEQEQARFQGILDELEQRIKDVSVQLQNNQLALIGHRESLDARQAALDTAKEAIPDVDDIRKRLGDIEEKNRQVRFNLKREAALAEEKHLEILVKTEDDVVDRIGQEKLAAIGATQFPIKGLGLSDDGVTFNGLPFEQASKAEQIKVSVAMGLALNPDFKVLLVRDGNVLDSKSLAAVAEQAAAADAQLWMEWVAESKDGVAVMLEDGSVV